MEEDEEGEEDKEGMMIGRKRLENGEKVNESKI